ncbi:fumarylacetoacetate hydrolase family protein [Sutcliffiella rhizosphaerae]|uniref:Fumarylacetoacetase-like C-terminal domain-containing protein n=1 Tax=Sutcliffiella rhizosphaerae TaxID=2880967 RepID=A0ABM8YU16_9BACI|nr:fumarylacetoacetate hydrolase family protein [Sutcliffiella rhizosphaerae]CAG9623466.1 putative protein YisK [Sutcliffiella rhizosphaerae]
MRFVTVEKEGNIFYGLVDETLTEILDLAKASHAMGMATPLPSTLLQCLELGETFVENVLEIKEWINKQDETSSYVYKISDITLLAPIPRPLKNILCVGKNYKDHVLEMGNEADIPEHIMIFTKAPTTVIGHDTSIPLHAGVTSQLDYEGELAIVIGKKGTGISEEEAMDYVFGYSILNDITARDLQTKHKQFFLGKSLDGSCPMGPVLVHKSAFTNPQNVLLSTRINGELRQQASTELMIFSLPEIISTLSKGMTLEPGDIIATGTPAGVGKGFNPPKFLKRGDVIEISIDGIGSLRNIVE